MKKVCVSYQCLMLVAAGLAVPQSLVLPGCAAAISEAASANVPHTNVLTMDQAIQLALKNNPGMRVAGGKVQAAAGRARQAGVWSNPELELSAEDWPVNHGGFSDAKQLVGVSQTLPFPGKKKLDSKVGAAGIRLNEQELSLRRLELIRDVKTAFFQVLTAERLVELSRELVNVTESSAVAAQKRVEAGAAPDQELLRAQIPLEQARTELAGFQREVAAARETLAALLGRPEAREVTVSGALAEASDATLLEHGPDKWLPKHPSTMAARINRDRADMELRRAKLEPYPDVNVGVAGGREEGPERSSIVQFRVALPMPIIDRSKGKKDEAQANINIAEAEQAAIEQRLLRDWGTGSKRVKVAAEQVANYRERILPKANEALRLVRTGFEQGKFGFIDLLDTQRTAAEARLAYQQKLLELNVAQAELEAVVARIPATAKNFQPGEPGTKK